MNKYLRFFIPVLLFQLGVLLNAQNIATQEASNFSNVSKIVVDADFCTVKLKGHLSKEVLFNGIIKSNENVDEYKLLTEVVDGILKITVQKPESWTSHWGEITLMIPMNMEINVQSKSGKVDMSLLIACNVTVGSKSGHVIVDSCNGVIKAVSPAGDFVVDKFDGSFKADSKSGVIILRDCKGDFEVGSDKGHFTISNLKGNLKTDGGDGAQEIENVEGNMALKSTKGEIKLSLSKGNITTRSFNGAQKLFQTEGVYNVQSSSGNITGSRVMFTASSSFTSSEGNIKMQMNTKSDLAFVLKSDNSFLRAMGKSKKKSLKAGKGSILITGISTTGSQAYY